MLPATSSAASPAFSNSAPAAPAAPTGGAGPQAPHLRAVPTPTPTPVPGAGGGGSDQLDNAQLLRALQQSTQRQQTYERDLGTLREKTTQQDELLGRLRGVFQPQQPQANPLAERRAHAEAQMDYYLQQALEADRAGRPMPLTANLAAQVFQGQIEASQKEEALMARIAELERGLTKATDPGLMIDQQAFTTMDSAIQRGLATIYGQGPEYQAQRAHQFRAVAAQVADEIKYLKQKDPGSWDEIRRDNVKIGKMVNYFVEQNLPPRARQILQNEQIMREPQSVEGMFQAFREAQVAYADDPKQLQNVTAQIRREILATQMAQRRGSGQQRVSGMYGGR